jgi:hypothetical protein
LGLALKFSLYRILFFSGFGLGKIHCISGFGLGKIHCISGFGLGKIHCISGFGLGKIHCISGFSLGKIHCIFKRGKEGEQLGSLIMCCKNNKTKRIILINDGDNDFF